LCISKLRRAAALQDKTLLTLVLSDLKPSNGTSKKQKSRFTLVRSLTISSIPRCNNDTHFPDYPTVKVSYVQASESYICT
jgi:hypothetical protein